MRGPMHRRTPRPRSLAGALALVVLAACETPPQAPMPDVAELSLEDAPETLGGTIDGEPFEVRDARVRVVRYAGREHVDLLLSDRPIERCGLPMERPETLVWLRFEGEEALARGRYAAGGDETLGDALAAQLGEAAVDRTVTVHWERPIGEGHTRDVHAGGRGVGLVQLEPFSPTRVRGRLHVCFADARGPQCVRGRFDASPCLSRIDGRTAREPPGLIDEALEPRAASASPPLRPTRTYEHVPRAEGESTPTAPATTTPEGGAP